MEENEYRSTYHTVNQRRCRFEKAINARRCNCRQSHRFNLADREGVSCQSAAGHARCQAFLELLRHNAKFALQQTRIAGPLPHAKELKVQVGGLLGLQQLLMPEQPDPGNGIADIDGLLSQALGRYSDFEQLPYSEIVKSIVQFRGRVKRAHH